MLPQPILVSDEKYNDGNFVLLPYSYDIVKCVNGTTFIEGSKKIIAGIPELPSIDFSGLSEEDCKKIGWVDVEKIANEYYGAYFDVEVEMDFAHTDHVVGGFEYFPKITNNQIKITKAL